MIESDKHREVMIESFAQIARVKYDRGNEEHGGDLQAKSPLQLLMEIRDEAIDTFIYAQTAIDKLNTATKDEGQFG